MTPATTLRAHLPPAVAAAFLTCLLAGCATTYPTPTSEPPPAPAETGKAPEEQAGEDAAMLALLEESERALDAGDLALSISVLERALRIEPRRADLWTALARAHLRDDAPERAVQFAERALGLAGNRVDWQRDAWLVIADAYSQLGREDEGRRIRRDWRTYEG